MREGYWGWASCAADFTNDGYLDIFHVNGMDEPGTNAYLQDPSRLFINNGDGSFTEDTAASGLEFDHPWTTSAGFFDYDRDGWLDLFVTNYIVWSPDTDLVCRTVGDRRDLFQVLRHARLERRLERRQGLHRRVGAHEVVLGHGDFVAGRHQVVLTSRYGLGGRAVTTAVTVRRLLFYRRRRFARGPLLTSPAHDPACPAALSGRRPRPPAQDPHPRRRER